MLIFVHTGYLRDCLHFFIFQFPVSQVEYIKTCAKRPLAKRPKIGFQDQLLLNAGQKHTFDLH